MATAEELTALLPEVLRAGASAPGPMAGLIDAMAGLLDPRAAMISRGRSLFDPLTAPVEMLPFLAHWLGRGELFVDPSDPRRTLALADGFPPGADRLRLFLAAGPTLHALRGSAAGLRHALQIATGRGGFTVVDETAAGHVRITAPASLRHLEAWLRRLIAAERPAHMTWSLRVGEGSGGEEGRPG